MISKYLNFLKRKIATMNQQNYVRNNGNVFFNDYIVFNSELINISN